MAVLSPTTENPSHPRSHNFRYRSANYYAVQTLDSLQIRGVIKSWFYEPADNLFGVHTHAKTTGPLLLTPKEVGPFETGAVAVLNAVIVGGLTVEEIHKGVAGLKGGK